MHIKSERGNPGTSLLMHLDTSQSFKTENELNVLKIRNLTKPSKAKICVIFDNSLNEN